MVLHTGQISRWSRRGKRMRLPHWHQQLFTVKLPRWSRRAGSTISKANQEDPTPAPGFQLAHGYSLRSHEIYQSLVLVIISCCCYKTRTTHDDQVFSSSIANEILLLRLVTLGIAVDEYIYIYATRRGIKRGRVDWRQRIHKPPEVNEGKMGLKSLATLLLLCALQSQGQDCQSDGPALLLTSIIRSTSWPHQTRCVPRWRSHCNERSLLRFVPNCRRPSNQLV